MRSFIDASCYPDCAALYQALAAVEAEHLGTEFSTDPVNSLRSYFRCFFRRLAADGVVAEIGDEVPWPKSPLAWRVFFVEHYGAMLPGLARYFAPGTPS